LGKNHASHLINLLILISRLANTYFLIPAGKNFIGSIVRYVQGVAQDIENCFANGEVSKLLTLDHIKAFDNTAVSIVQRFSSGKYDLDTVIQLGNLIIQGVQIAVDFIVAGITDLANAIGDFFKSFINFLDCVFQETVWFAL